MKKTAFRKTVPIKSEATGSAERQAPRALLPARGKVFRDPVHGLIRIQSGDEFLLQLIDTPAMQRLRRIRQLGVSYLTYHGAEHSRFSHSMGVLAMAQRILDTLAQRYGKDTDVIQLIDEHSREVKAAALLHDVGHGPFSHMVERFSKTVHHESRTSEIIADKDSDVCKILKKSGVDPERVRAIINKTFEYPFLQDVVSSQLDADRMDYILRDAHFTGVRYGAYDSDWLLNALCIGLEPDPMSPVGPPYYRLCLDDSRGRYSAEQLIIARFHMSMQVYFHRSTRRWEAHLLMLFQRAARLAQKNMLPAQTPETVRKYFKGSGQLSLVDFLMLDETSIVSAMQIWANLSGTDDYLQRLSMQFLKREKALDCRGISGEAKHLADRIKLEKALEKGLGPKMSTWVLDEIPFRSYKNFGPLAGNKNPDDAAASSAGILVSDGKLDSRARPIEDCSYLFRTLGDGSKQTFVCRLYFHQTVREDMENILKKFSHLLFSTP